MSIHKDKQLQEAFMPTVTPKPKLPATNAGWSNVVRAVREEDGSGNSSLGARTYMKYNKERGYFTRDHDIPLDSEAIVIVRALATCWVKFRNGTLADRKVAKPYEGEKLQSRESLGELEEDTWEVSRFTGRKEDPWIFQFLVPMELVEDGEGLVFVGQTVGGRRAVADLIDACDRKLRPHPELGNPVVTLSVINMPTKYSKTGTPRPNFPIIGWNNEDRTIPDFPTTSQEEIDDTIPY